MTWCVHSKMIWYGRENKQGFSFPNIKNFYQTLAIKIGGVCLGTDRLVKSDREY